ncbi:hypothetical protein CSUNSWCD_1256 [Campylobacter showae CSUNSWCD]|jgi:hypothetical protein|uniref:Uncharacterized protein n=1 Tax=Campylobacter showae CSUNSWCD TaxID=1244083 RepID=M5IHC2_9BACT|nr:hypothetical protein CSUNSWCD_1256 [Campylobacter showae CSUNSWCD]
MRAPVKFKSYNLIIEIRIVSFESKKTALEAKFIRKRLDFYVQIFLFCGFIYGF